MKKLLAGSMAVLILGVHVVTAQPEQVNRTIESEVNVSFVEYNRPKSPLPPTPDPEDPGSGGGVLPDRPGTGMIGLVSIDYISSFNFGEITQVIDPTTHPAVVHMMHTALPDQGQDQVDIPNFIQVTDNRTLSERDGWILTVEKLNDLTRLDANGLMTDHTLEATALRLSDLNVRSDTLFETPWVNDSLLLMPQIPDVIARAVVTDEDGSVGSGTWVISFGDVEEVGVELITPTNESIEANEGYMAVLRWVLSDTPL